MTTPVDTQPSGRGEKRAAQRAVVAVPLRLRIADLDAVTDGQVVNVSRSGMFIAMEQPVEVGTHIDVEIVVGKGHLVLHAVVEVVRRQLHRPPIGVGARFVEVSYEAQALIDRIVDDSRAFGAYRLQSLIGTGGMAEVYRAKALDGEHVGQVVALKRMRPEVAQDPTFTALFRREATITRQLHHPNIVDVLDVGAVGGRPYIVMDFIQGCDLQRILNECCERGILMPIDFACYVVQTVAEALDFAHRARATDGTPLGIVHRDVAPSNIFISDLGEIKLGDFGVAQVAVAAESDQRIIAGRPQYLAPEQIRGEPVGPAADVFSLGAVFYEMLTNTAAFDGPNRRAIWKQILKGKARALSRLRPEVSPDLERLVQRALSAAVPRKSGLLGRRRANEEPTRFADAATFAHELSRLYDPAIGTQMAIASVVRSLLRARSPSRPRDTGSG